MVVMNAEILAAQNKVPLGYVREVEKGVGLGILCF